MCVTVIYSSPLWVHNFKKVALLPGSRATLWHRAQREREMFLMDDNCSMFQLQRSLCSDSPVAHSLISFVMSFTRRKSVLLKQSPGLRFRLAILVIYGLASRRPLMSYG
jgi:hypothetical protein